MKLFSVTTIVPDYSRSQNVEFRWFRHRPELPWPYTDLVENYEPDDTEAEDMVDEYFTESEAIALKDYLDRNFGEASNTTIGEVTLPSSKNSSRRLASVAVSTPGDTGFYRLSDAPDYSLGFDVSGYFHSSNRDPVETCCPHCGGSRWLRPDGQPNTTVLTRTADTALAEAAQRSTP